MRLIFIRHPRTEANERKLVYGRTDALYSEAGKQTIPGILEELRGIDIDRLYSSPLTRTRLLAEAIAADHNMPAEEICMDDRILEMDFGKFENMTIPELEERYPEEYAEYIRDFNDYVVPGGESYRQLYHRVCEFLEDVYRRHELGEGAAADNDMGWMELNKAAAGTSAAGAKTVDVAAMGAAQSLEQSGEDSAKDDHWFGKKNAMAKAEKRKEETVVVVSHSMVIHAALAHLLTLDLGDVWHIKVEPGSMVDLDWRCEFAMLQGLSGPFNIRATR